MLEELNDVLKNIEIGMYFKSDKAITNAYCQLNKIIRRLENNDEVRDNKTS